VEGRLPRKLAVILYADAAGYSRLTGEDEEGTHRRLSACLDTFAAAIRNYGGHVVHYAGDAILAEFPGVSRALACAASVQQALETQNEASRDERRIRFRVGVNLGEVIVDRSDLYGTGVNVAVRLEEMAEPGGICVSESVRDAAGSEMPLEYDHLGEQEIERLPHPVKAYRVQLDPQAVLPGPDRAAEPGQGFRRRGAAAIVAALALAAAAITAWVEPWGPKTGSASIEQMALPLPDQPSIAVLPFDNLTGSDGEEYLVDGLTGNIITELSRFSEFFVIARSSSFAYKDEPVSIGRVAEELGVRYVLEGSVQMNDDKVRVTAQLIDAISGKHLWAERFERGMQDVFTVQDEITRTIAATLEENISLAEQDRALREPADNLSAYETRKRAQAAWLTFTREGTEQSQRLYEKTLALDPDYSEAYSGLAWVYINRYRYGWTNTLPRIESLDKALEMARKGVELAPFNHRAHWVLGKATMLKGDLDRALGSYDKALELNPNSADVFADSAEVLVYLGRADEAIGRMRSAIRLNPIHPDWYLWNLGWALYCNEQYEEALSTLRDMSRLPNMARRTLAAVLVELGRLEQARSVVAKFREQLPDYTLEDLEIYPYQHREYAERWADDLRKAGLPEG